MPRLNLSYAFYGFIIKFSIQYAITLYRIVERAVGAREKSEASAVGFAGPHGGGRFGGGHWSLETLLQGGEG